MMMTMLKVVAASVVRTEYTTCFGRQRAQNRTEPFGTEQARPGVGWDGLYSMTQTTGDDLASSSRFAGAGAGDGDGAGAGES